MPMYWFPRWEYTKESLYRQKLKGLQQKGTEDTNVFEELAECRMGFDWEPANIISSGLDSHPTASPTTSMTLAGGPTSPLSTARSCAPSSCFAGGRCESLKGPLAHQAHPNDPQKKPLHNKNA